MKKAKKGTSPLTLDWTALSMEAKWYDFESGELLGRKTPKAEEGKGFIQVKPYPHELMEVKMEQGGLVLSGVKQKEMYDHCFLGMVGFPGADGKAVRFSPEVKQAIYDFQLLGIPAFVILKSRLHANKRAATLGN